MIIPRRIKQIPEGRVKDSNPITPPHTDCIEIVPIVTTIIREKGPGTEEIISIMLSNILDLLKKKIHLSSLTLQKIFS